jgi:hypothetical protein
MGGASCEDCTDWSANPMNELKEQLQLFTDSATTSSPLLIDKINSSNSLEEDDKAFHGWYRFVLSYPPHLVRHYLGEFNVGLGGRVLDPFCGTGTTIVEAKLNGLIGIGFEANPFPHFASSVKVDWIVDPNELVKCAHIVANEAQTVLRSQGIDELGTQGLPKTIDLRALEPEANKLLITNSISPLPLHKTLVLLDCLQKVSMHRCYNHLLLALGNALVTKISNLRFGPEVGVGRHKKDVMVIPSWLADVRQIARDLQSQQGKNYERAEVFLADSRNVSNIIEPQSIDAVITSPPYPNEKDYTRTTRLESVLLGFYTTKAELQALKKTLVRSNTRGVYSADTDDQWIQHVDEIQSIANQIETRRIELGKTSGFERLYARLTRLYFGGMARHLAELRGSLRPGAQLAYVVGDQASYLRVMIRTGKLLAEIAQDLGYEVIRIDLFRTRYATATQTDLNEEVVVLRWPG